MKREINAAETLVKSLEDLGVRHVYGYTGGAILPVFHALGKSDKIKLIVNSNEQSCAFSAAGCSRSSDKVGVAIVTSGPATTNTLTAVVDSYTDSIPLLVFTGDVPQDKIGTDAFQHADTPEIFRKAAKGVYRACVLDNLEVLVKRAYYFAKSGKPGPVVIDIPLDLQQCVGGYQDLKPEVFSEKYDNKKHMSEDECREFFRSMQKAKKPLLYIGGGINSKGASEAIRKFNELFNIPYVNTLMAKGVMDEYHPLSLGMLGMFGTPYANMAVQETDFFFAMGVRWDDRVAERVGEFGPKAKIAYIDINPEKVDEIRTKRKESVEFSFVGDAETAIRDLIDYANRENIRIDIGDWQETARGLKRRWPLDYNRTSGCIQQAEVLDLLSKYIDKKTKITTGVGNHQMLSAHYLRMTEPKSFITSGSFGTMGFALPSAIGVHYANPDSRVIAVDGDGSIKMNMGEMHTIAEYGIPVKLLLLNNHGDGMVRNLQDVSYDGQHTGTERSSDVKFAKLAEVFGFKYSKRVYGRRELERAMAELLSSDGPSFLEVITDRNEAVYPKIPPGKTYREMNLGPYIKERIL